MTLLQDIANVALIGIGATVVMDFWLTFLKRMGVQTLNFEQFRVYRTMGWVLIPRQIRPRIHREGAADSW